MSSADASATRPRVLVVYYTYTHQSAKVGAEMAEVLRERGCDVREAEIEFTDARYAERFSRFSEIGVSSTRPGAFAAISESDRKSTRLNSSHMSISYAVFCLKKKKKINNAAITQYA